MKDLITNSVERIGAGVELVEAAGTDMREIVASVARVRSMIDDIAAAAGAQRNEIEQVNDAVSHMDSMTQQNAALVEEAAVASERMRENAHELSTAVAVFKVSNDIHNQRAARDARAA